jgi:hypothetical protein
MQTAQEKTIVVKYMQHQVNLCQRAKAKSKKQKAKSKKQKASVLRGYIMQKAETTLVVSSLLVES